MSKTKLDEIMEEVIPVYNGITDELESYELTKEQYKWFLLEAAAKEGLVERVKELEKELEAMKSHYQVTARGNNWRDDERIGLKQENQRYKQALEEIREYVNSEKFNDSCWDVYVINKMVNEALKGDSDG